MPFHATRFGAAALAGSLLLTGGGAFAQQAAPAAPAAPAQGQQAPPQGPVKVELKPSQAEWTKVCGKAGPTKEICFTTRDFTQSPDQPPLIALAVYDVKGEEPIVRFLMPPGLLIKPGHSVFDRQGCSAGRLLHDLPSERLLRRDQGQGRLRRADQEDDEPERRRQELGQQRSDVRAAHGRLRQGVRRAGGGSEGAAGPAASPAGGSPAPA